MRDNNEWAEIRKSIRELTKSQKKTDEQQKKTDEQLRRAEEAVKKAGERIDNLGELVGKVTDSWGKFVEGFVEPSIPKLFKERGINVTELHQRAKSHINGQEIEIDILAVGRNVSTGKGLVIIVQVSSSVGIRDVKRCMRDLQSFYDFFPAYRDSEVMGVIGGMRIPKNVKEYAENEGLYVLRPSEDTMRILNKEGFKPRIWRYAK